jgi:phosphoserine phosphatase RsbU/P
MTIASEAGGGGRMKELAERRILVVDDVKTHVDTLVRALQGDYKLSVALDGEAALRAVKSNVPDLVLLDVEMPGLDGYEVCKRLRSDPATAEVPVIFLTGLDAVKDKMAGFDAGGSDYVTKPFEILEVKARVKSLLQARAYQEARRELLSKELRIAREIQMSLVPRDFSRWDGSEVDIFGLLEPAREVGGDLYSVFPAGDGRLGLLFGDVSGKGVHAALFMAIASTLAKMAALHAESPEQVLSQVNAELAENNPSGMFVTLFCAFLDLATGRLVCASGGHTLPVLMRAGEPARFPYGAQGTIVGLLPGMPYKSISLDLHPGDLFIAYTDGVTEAFNPNEEAFGDDRLLDHVTARRPAAAREAVEGLLDAVRIFAAGAPQSDDIAILALRYLGPR